MTQPAIPPSYGPRQAQPLDLILEQHGAADWAWFDGPDPKDKRGSWEERLEERAAGAAAYLGLGAVWALGLSSSAAQLQANPASLPPSILSIRR